MAMITYRIAPGVTHINGSPAPKARKITLSEPEALFDLSLGRLLPPVGDRMLDDAGEKPDGRN